MVSVGFGNASGSGGSVRVARTARSAAVSSVTVPLGLKIDASVIDPSRLMVNRMRLVPLAPWSWFHAERMRRADSTPGQQGLTTEVADRRGVELVRVDAEDARDDGSHDCCQVEEHEDDEADHRETVATKTGPDDLA